LPNTCYLSVAGLKTKFMYKNKIIKNSKELIDRVDHLLWLGYDINEDETLIFNDKIKILVSDLKEFCHDDWIEWLYKK